MVEVNIGKDRLKYPAATIQTASTTSQEINLRGGTLCGLITPGTFTGTALTFTVSNTTGGTFVPLYDGVAGTQVSVTVTTSRAYALPPTLFAGWQYVKVVSNAGANGDAGRIVLLAVRGIE